MRMRRKKKKEKAVSGVGGGRAEGERGREGEVAKRTRVGGSCRRFVVVFVAFVVLVVRGTS